MRDIYIIRPLFRITTQNKKTIRDIENKLKLIKLDDESKNKNMRIKSKVRSIYSSLAIEANSLSIESVESIIDKKTVLGERKEIQEVKNANEVYEKMSSYNWKDENDFLKAHSLMMKYFEDDNDGYRNHGEGVKRGNRIIYSAPDSLLVPSLMASLFNYINDNEKDIHPLILSSLFHYYLVYIHPFSDGNGRMARFWVSLILADWNCKFQYIPIEEEIYLRQNEYYEAIAKSHVDGNCNAFIDFLLTSIDSLLEKTTQKTTQKIRLNENQIKMVKLIHDNPNITRNDISKVLNISPDGVKYNLKKLVDNNIIRRIGSNKGGHWEVLKNDMLSDN